MKREGFRHTKSLEGHQRCATCHPDLKGAHARMRRFDLKVAQESTRLTGPILWNGGVPSFGYRQLGQTRRGLGWIDEEASEDPLAELAVVA